MNFLLHVGRINSNRVLVVRTSVFSWPIGSCQFIIRHLLSFDILRAVKANILPLRAQ